MPSDEEPDDTPGFQPPLPPEDRLWRHPSEMGPGGGAQPITLIARQRPDTRVWAVAVLAGLIGAVIAVGALAGFGVFTDPKPEIAVEQIQRELPKQPGASDLAIADQVIPAVVRVEATGSGSATGGSAVVFRTDGHLLTTADAVDGADQITVTWNDGTTSGAQLVGIDQPSDLAVLKVDRTDLPSAVIGQPTNLQLGEPAIAVATTPERPSAPTVSVGLVSALAQRVDASDGWSLYGMIQSNVRLGSSGAGAVLIDSSGSVVGIITGRGPRARTISGSSGSAGGDSGQTDVPTRYATPIDYAKVAADEIIGTGHVTHTWLGIEGVDLEGREIDSLGRSGAKIASVADDGPAASAGLETGDVIVSIDHSTIDSMSALVVALRVHQPTDVVAVGFVRRGEQQAVLATLSEKDTLP